MREKVQRVQVVRQQWFGTSRHCFSLVAKCHRVLLMAAIPEILSEVSWLCHLLVEAKLQQRCAWLALLEFADYVENVHLN